MLELNKVYFEDCLIGMQKIDDKSIDMILADLPYGNATHLNWDKIIDLEKLWIQYERIIKDDAAIVLFSAQPFTSKLVLSNLLLYKYEIIWEKDRISNIFQIRTSFGRVHENILIFSKGNIKYDSHNLMKYYPQGVSNDTSYGKTYMKENSVHGKQNTKRYKMHGKNYPRSVLKYPCQYGKLHPTQKPIELMEYLIQTYTKENELVLDNVIGSGTTAIACLNTNRNYIGFENNPKYYQICVDRIEKHKNTLQKGL